MLATPGRIAMVSQDDTGIPPRAGVLVALDSWCYPHREPDAVRDEGADECLHAFTHHDEFISYVLVLYRAPVLRPCGPRGDDSGGPSAEPSTPRKPWSVGIAEASRDESHHCSELGTDDATNSQLLAGAACLVIPGTAPHSRGAIVPNMTAIKLPLGERHRVHRCPRGGKMTIKPNSPGSRRQGVNPKARVKAVPP
jgi:hypothetical protein